jgi:hypothetical protein
MLTGSPITCIRTDQRGYVRPFDGDGNGVAVSDMGAFDLGHIPTSLSHGCTYRWWKNNDEIVMGMSPRQAA